METPHDSSALTTEVLIRYTSKPSETKKIVEDHSFICSSSHNTKKPSTENASCTIKLEEGRVISMVSKPCSTESSDAASNLAESLAREISTPNTSGALVNGLLQLPSVNPKSHQFAAARSFPRNDGTFEVVSITTDETFIIAYNPTDPENQYQTLETDKIAEGIYYAQTTLPEGSVVLCFNKSFFSYIPVRLFRMFKENGDATDIKVINFEKIFKKASWNNANFSADLSIDTEKLTVHSTTPISGSQLAAVFMDYVAREASNTKKGEFFLLGMDLIHTPPEANPLFNPANWSPEILATLIIGCSLSFVVPEAFLGAAPYLTGIFFGGAVIAAAALLIYGIDFLIRDFDYQSKKTVSPKKFEDSTIHDSKPLNFLTYITTSVFPRTGKWLIQHPLQLTFGIITTGMMIATLSLTIWWAVNPIGMDANVVGHVFKLFFDFLANTMATAAAQLNSSLSFKVGSIFSKYLVTTISALSVLVIGDFIRRLAVACYEKYKSYNPIATPYLDDWIKRNESRALEQQRAEFSNVLTQPEAPKKQAPQEFYGYISSKTFGDHIVKIIAPVENNCWKVNMINNIGELLQEMIVEETDFKTIPEYNVTRLEGHYYLLKCDPTLKKDPILYSLDDKANLILSSDDENNHFWDNVTKFQPLHTYTSWPKEQNLQAVPH